LIGGGVALFVPRFHYAISGWWQGEAFFAGRPTSYWAEAAQGGFYAGERDVFRSLREGGTSAVPVLCELSKSQDVVLRSQAMLALSLIDWDPRQVPASTLRLLYADSKSMKLDGAAARLSQENRRALEDTLLDIVHNAADPEDRSSAALALDRLGSPSAPDALSKAMRNGSRDPDIRLSISLRLWEHHHNPDEVLPAIDERLASRGQTPNTPEFHSSVHFLGQVGRRDKHAALTRLQALIHDPVPEARRSAYSAIAQLASEPDTKDLLTAGLNDSDAGVRYAVAQSIAQNWPNEKTAIPILLERLRDTHFYHTSVYLLRRVGVRDRETIGALVQVVQSSDDAGIRAACADALGDVAPGYDDAVQALITAVAADTAIGVRQSAVFALMRLKAHAAVPVLVHIATDRGPGSVVSLREAAARALGAMNSEPAAVLALVGVLKDDPNRTLRRTAAGLLGQAKVEKQAAVKALSGAADDRETRIAVAVAISQLDPGNRRPVDILLNMLETNDESSKSEALLALGQLGPRAKVAIPALLGIIARADADPLSALMAISTLGRMGPAAEAAVPALAKKLGTDDAISMTTLEALAQLGPAARIAIPALRSTLASSSVVYYRIKAAVALCKIDEKTDPYVPVIVECLRDKSPAVRGAAISALGDLGPIAVSAVPALRDALDDPRTEHMAREALRKITSRNGPAEAPFGPSFVPVSQ
jgi:HEAT repeat protein